MSDIPHTFLALVGLCFAAVLIGGSMAFGIATVCRWLKWAPVNTVININNYREADTSIIYPEDATAPVGTSSVDK